MKISARNQLQGTITEIIQGQVNSELTIDIDGVSLKSMITSDAVNEMGLAVTQPVCALIKASFIMLATEKPNKISTINVLETRVSDIIHGAINCQLKLAMGNNKLTAIISEESLKELNIKKNTTVYALIRASSVILAQ